MLVGAQVDFRPTFENNFHVAAVRDKEDPDLAKLAIRWLQGIRVEFKMLEHLCITSTQVTGINDQRVPVILKTDEDRWRTPAPGHFALLTLIVAHRHLLAVAQPKTQREDIVLFTDELERGLTDSIRDALNGQPWSQNAFGIKIPSTVIGRLALAHLYKVSPKGHRHCAAFLFGTRANDLKAEQVVVSLDGREITDAAELAAIQKELAHRWRTLSKARREEENIRKDSDSIPVSADCVKDSPSGGTLDQTHGAKEIPVASADPVARPWRRLLPLGISCVVLAVATFLVLERWMREDTSQVWVIDDFDTPPDWQKAKPFLTATAVPGGRRDIITQGGEPLSNLVSARLVSHDQLQVRIKAVSQASGRGERTNLHGYLGFWYAFPTNLGRLREVVLEVTSVELSSENRSYPPALKVELKRHGEVLPIRTKRVTTFTESGGPYRFQIPIGESRFTFDRVNFVFDKGIPGDAITFDKLSFVVTPP